jgi:hypothetical protein
MLRPALCLLVVASACTPAMQLQVLEPSLVTSPPEIRKLAVIDRSRAKNVGQGILGVLEGAVTGEAIGADNAGRSRAMTGLVTGLRNSPRFEAAETFLPKKELESSLFDTELSWGTAKSICKMQECQGIVSLEAFDSDTTTNIRTEVETSTGSDGKEINETMGTGLIMVEQNVPATLKVVERAIILKAGRVVFDGSARELSENKDLWKWF